MSSPFLSTPSARRATLLDPVLEHPEAISIHALREEGDRRRWSGRAPWSNFYPRPPRGGRRTVPSPTPATKTFLSTPSARRATTATTSPSPAARFLSTPSARRATADAPFQKKSTAFLSTPSARRATGRNNRPAAPSDISIHALREEGDGATPRHSRARRDFYPRPPRGGRPA